MMGLHYPRLKYYFNSLKLETEFINPKPKNKLPLTGRDDLILDAIRAYIECGLPVVATLNHKGTDEYHAVLITGYKHVFGKITEIYVHDDNIGPYHRIVPNRRRKFTSWGESDLSGNKKEYEIQRLLVPVYPKIRLSFGKVYRVFLSIKRGDEELVKHGSYHKDDMTILYLTDIRRYRNDLLKRKFDGKASIIQESAPRFLWVIRRHNKCKPKQDYVLDGTAISPNNVIWDIVFKD